MDENDQANNNCMSPPARLNMKSNEEAVKQKVKQKKRLLHEVAKADKRGVCYLSWIPPHMDHVKLRQILSQYGEIQRIYLAPKDPSVRAYRQRAGGLQGKGFSEGWVEFTKKTVAKRVADALNGEQIGGKKRSVFYYNIWNIKYLTRFKWDDLTEEIAYKQAIREKKLALEISAAKREREFYLSKVDQSRALSSIEERLKKKQKVQQIGENSEQHVNRTELKIVRQVPQKKPVANDDTGSKSRLSNDILVGIFGASSQAGGA